MKIEINEDGTRIAISGEKLVQEMVMVGWIMYKKEMEMRGFRKVFKIPDGVILDKINSRFNEEESVLTISMPKAVKGIRGGGVEEVKEEQVVEKLPDSSPKKEEQKAESSTLENQDQGTGTVEPTRIAHDQASQEKGIEAPPPLVQKDQVGEGNTADEIPRVERKMEGEESEREEFSRGVVEPKEDKSGHEIDEIDTPPPEQVTDMVQEVEVKDEIEKRGTDIEGNEHEKEDMDVNDEDEEEKCREEVYRDEPLEREKEKSLGDEATQGKQPREKSSKICCVPIIAGSAFLLSITVLVIHLIRKKNQPRKN